MIFIVIFCENKYEVNEITEYISKDLDVEHRVVISSLYDGSKRITSKNKRKSILIKKWSISSRGTKDNCILFSKRLSDECISYIKPMNVIRHNSEMFICKGFQIEDIYNINWNSVVSCM